MVINGTDLRIWIDDVLVADAISHSISIKMGSGKRNTKDTGKFSSASKKRLEFTGTSESLTIYGNLDLILLKIFKKEAVKMDFGNIISDDEKTLDFSLPFITGNFLLTGIDKNDPDNSESTFTISFELSSNFNLVPNKFILDLEPIFWIQDLTKIKDGFLIDSSGNDKKIAISTDDAENDTMTFPANDSDIINALKADGNYRYFYTNDSTPLPVRIGNIPLMGSRYLFAEYFYKNMILFSSAPSLANQTLLFEFLNIDKVWLPNINFAKQLNFNRPINPNTLLTNSEFSSNLNPNLVTISANEFSWSVSKKTQTFQLPGSGTIRYGNSFFSQRMSGGNFKLSFWINRTQDPSPNVILCYTYLAYKANSVSSMWHTAVDLNTLNNTSNGNMGDYTFTTIVKDIQGDWSRVEISFFCENDGNHNYPVNANMGISIGLYDETPSVQNFDVVDIIMVKDYLGTLSSNSLLTAPYEIMGSKLLGKNLCIIGDSITLGGLYAIKIQFDYGLEKIFNCGQGGRRMVNGTNSLNQDLSIVIEQPAEILTILASANDCGSPIGSIDSTNGDTYLGAYNNYLSYLLTHLPDENEKVILITCPFIIGSGNSIQAGKAEYKTQFQNMANGVKALGIKYNLPVCDLHGNMPMTFENSPIFLSDRVHWSNMLHHAAGKIIGKFINNLY